MFRNVLAGILLLFVVMPIGAQTGETIYPFLQLPASVSASGVGGNSVSSPEKDLNLVFHNPALLDASMDRSMEVGYLNYLADIRLGSVAFARRIDDRSQWMAGVRYIHYGEMVWTNAQNEVLGSTYAGDLCLTGSYARQLSTRWRAGLSLSAIYSVLDEYTSMGLCADVGLFYAGRDGLTSAGIVLKRVGAEVMAYDDTYERLPIDLQLGWSKKFAHAPLRFTLTLQHLFQGSYEYLQSLSTEETGTTSYSLPQKLMMHTLLGFEFVPSDRFLLSLGYNYRRRMELAVEQRTPFSGFTAGFSLKLPSMRVGASYARYHLSGGSLQMTYAMNLSKLGL
jgi:hypothetical protein